MNPDSSLFQHTPHKRSYKYQPKEPAEDRHCSSCGTNVTPEWRRGPNGPKTLCNACGLQFAKKSTGKEKSSTGAPSMVSSKKKVSKKSQKTSSPSSSSSVPSLSPLSSPGSRRHSSAGLSLKASSDITRAPSFQDAEADLEADEVEEDVRRKLSREGDFVIITEGNNSRVMRSGEDDGEDADTSGPEETQYEGIKIETLPASPGGPMISLPLGELSCDIPPPTESLQELLLFPNGSPNPAPLEGSYDQTYSQPYNLFGLGNSNQGSSSFLNPSTTFSDFKQRVSPSPGSSCSFPSVASPNSQQSQATFPQQLSPGLRSIPQPKSIKSDPTLDWGYSNEMEDQDIFHVETDGDYDFASSGFNQEITRIQSLTQALIQQIFTDGQKGSLPHVSRGQTLTTNISSSTPQPNGPIQHHATDFTGDFSDLFQMS